jgi:hypothetical protein
LTVIRGDIAVVILIGCVYALAPLVLGPGAATFEALANRFTKMVVGTLAIGIVCAILGARA